ncbi:MAG: hypothetical protein LC799_13380 [Actinobacteria bacterium]|nr:hypothetical protein [Actinomycetota bacterium]
MVDRQKTAATSALLAPESEAVAHADSAGTAQINAASTSDKSGNRRWSPDISSRFTFLASLISDPVPPVV